MAYRYKENSTDFVDVVMKELEVIAFCSKIKMFKLITIVSENQSRNLWIFGWSLFCEGGGGDFQVISF